MSWCAIKSKSFRQLRTIFRTRYGRFTNNHCCHDPSDIMIFTTTRCNLKCRTCPFTHSSPYSPDPSTPDISTEFLKKVLNHYRGASMVGLVGGEPLLHPDIIQLINICREKKMTVNLSTNGLLMDTKMSRQLLDSSPGFINISLDAPDAEEYQRVRGGEDEVFNRILNNARSFCELKKETGSSTKLWLSFVTDQQNLHRIPDFIDLAKDIGADHVFCQNILSYQTSDLTTGSGVLMDTPENRSRLKSLTIPDDIQVTLPPLVPLDDDCRCVRCKHPFTMLSIDGGGNLSPCCVIPPHPKYGTLKDDVSNWRTGKKLCQIRQEMINGDDAFEDICLDCWERFSMGTPHE